MVQMKVTASVLIAAAAIAPAVAYGFDADDSLVTREDNDLAGVYARGYDLDLTERDFDEELYQREPMRGMFRQAKKFFRGGNRHGSAPPSPSYESQQSDTREFNDDLMERDFNDDLYERDFDEELYQREPMRGMFRQAKKFFRGGNRHGSAPPSPTYESQQSDTREFNDELMEREFTDDLMEREFDEELYQREPMRGMFRQAKKFFRGGNRHGSPPPSPSYESQQSDTREFNDELMERDFNDDLYERDFDEELYQREPMRGMFRQAKKFFRGGNRHGSPPPSPSYESQQSDTREFNDDLMERDFNDDLYEREVDDELFAREYDSELFGREPEPLFGFIKKWFNKKKAPAPDAEAAPVEARSFDELD